MAAPRVEQGHLVEAPIPPRRAVASFNRDHAREEIVVEGFRTSGAIPERVHYVIHRSDLRLL